MRIELENISKRFGDFHALNEINLSIPSGGLTALLGPSGSGKTTLLRVIAGLENPESGRILFDGEDTTASDVRERRVGFVFQHYALFRHMTVFENVSFGLRVRPREERPSKKEILERVNDLLHLLQLENFSDRYPVQLSGGQRQRVALARALAVEPQVMLLDEPFGALDAKIRLELRRWLRRLHDKINLTTVFVTHDQEEALEVADVIVITNEGRIEQVGTPEQVYEAPANPFVMDFLGHVNLFRGRVHSGLAYLEGIELPAPEHHAAEDVPAVGYVRPHDLVLERKATGSGSIRARVERTQVVGSVARVSLTINGNHETIEAELTRDLFLKLALVKGEIVYVRPRNVRVFADDEI